MYGAYKCTKWRCRKCHFINEGFNIAICKKCSCPKSSGESLQVLPGDWTCNECNCSNFARRQNCYKCSLPRPKKAKFKEIPADQDCLRVGELLCDDTQQIDGDPSPKNEGETLIIPDSYQNEDDETHSNADSDASTTIGAEDEVSEDPSLASELSCLYKHFFKEGYSAMGMYLKCIHYLMDAYLNKYLSPEERVFKVWYCKTFFMTWNKGKKHASQFITDETFKDINCCCDGLILYLLLLKKEFPSSAIVTYYLGSDPNEQAYAFCRISQFAGRRTNLSAMTLACGLEKLNIRSAQPGDEPFQIAHTRGKHVMKKAVPLDHEIIPDDPEVVPVWFGNSLNEQTIRNTIKTLQKPALTTARNWDSLFS